MTVEAFKVDDKTIKFTFPSATAIAANDLLYNNSGVAAKASAQADQGTEALNQALFASLFLGLAADQRLSTETGTATRTVRTDAVVKVTCPSTTWAVGDLVGASENSGGDGLENQQVEKVTDPSLAIGYCVEAGTSITSVWVRLISRYTPQAVRAILAGSYGDDDAFAMGDSSDFQLLWSTADADNHSSVLALGDTNQTLHVTDVGAKATDWNVAAKTHPTVAIHSNTTPATDYMEIGNHDATNAKINVASGGLLFQLDGATEMTLAAGLLTLKDAFNIAVNATTGTKIGTATSQKLGFFNATPVVQPSAYTQTYSTADKTLAAIITVGTLGGTANGALETVGNTMGGDVSGAIMNNFQEFLAEVTDIKQALNAVIDDLQALGLVG